MNGIGATSDAWPAAPSSAHDAGPLSRMARYEAAIELGSLLLAAEDAAHVWQCVGARFKYCASWQAWRLSRTADDRTLQVAAGDRASPQVARRAFAADAWPGFDRDQWARWVPRSLTLGTLRAQAAAAPELPEQWAALPDGALLVEMPLQMAGRRQALLTLLTLEPAFDALDRKFCRWVGQAVVARLQALEQQQASQAERLAAQLHEQRARRSQMLAHLMSGLQHELNTPLGVQAQWLELLAEQAEALRAGAVAPDEAASFVLAATEGVAESQRRLARLVQAMRAASGWLMASGQEDFELRGWVREFVAARKAESAAPDVRDECGSGDGPWMQIDPSGLAIVLNELLDNIARHAPGSAATLRLLRDAGSLTLQIEDDGPGWGAFDPAHYVMPFASSRRVDGHLGLGGFIARNLAHDLLGATLEGDSRSSGGLVVRLVWPCGAAEGGSPEDPIRGTPLVVSMR